MAILWLFVIMRKVKSLDQTYLEKRLSSSPTRNWWFDHRKARLSRWIKSPSICRIDCCYRYAQSWHFRKILTTDSCSKWRPWHDQYLPNYHWQPRYSSKSILRTQFCLHRIHHFNQIEKLIIFFVILTNLWKYYLIITAWLDPSLTIVL